MGTLRLRMSVLAIALLLQAGLIQAPLASPAQFGLSPDNNGPLLLSTLRSARSELLINIYEFENRFVADAIVERIRAGATVQILFEGQPFGTVSSATKQIFQRIHRAMKISGVRDHRIFVLDTGNDPTKRRWVYNHAKYVIADGVTVLVSSENFSTTGHGAPGRIGNRGWDAVVTDASLGRRMTRLFADDVDSRHPDLVIFGPGDDLIYSQDRVEPEVPAEPQPLRGVPSIGVGAGVVSRADVITSPDSESKLVSLMAGARTNLDIQHMNLPSTWRNDAKELYTSPLVEGALRAARRGVAVRVLLNDDAVFGGSGPKANDITVKLLEEAAVCDRLPIAARIINVAAAGLTYIHNKGMLIDGKRALVSSINGTRNSVLRNRELGLVLHSSDAAHYYGQAYDFDWKSSPPRSRLSPSRVDCARRDLSRLLALD